MEILKKNGRASAWFPHFTNKIRLNKIRRDMKPDVSVNSDRDNPKRLKQNILKYLKRKAWLNKLEDFQPKVS